MSRQRSIEKIQASDYVSIGELARLTGCRYSTLKFYTEEGMLPFEQPEENLTRRFPREKAVARLRRVRHIFRCNDQIVVLHAKIFMQHAAVRVIFRLFVAQKAHAL